MILSSKLIGAQNGLIFLVDAVGKYGNCHGKCEKTKFPYHLYLFISMPMFTRVKGRDESWNSFVEKAMRHT